MMISVKWSPEFSSFYFSLGSAVFKSFFPAFLSSLVYVLLFYVTDLEEDDDQIFDHPYPMGALISALTFLLAFRANFAYNRYWEAVTAIHQMHSKWLDVGMDMAAFHLQSDRYEKRRPPSFGQHPELTDLNRHRERENETTLEELEEQLNSAPDVPSNSLRSRVQRSFFRRRRRKPRNEGDNNAPNKNDNDPSSVLAKDVVLAMSKPQKRKKYKSINRTTTPAKTSATFTSVFASVFSSRPKTPIPVETSSSTNLVVRTDSARHFDQAWEHGKPPLFLQEGAHLLSLLSAVAFSTLRNDLEQADTPLTTFIPGAPWPHVDPDAYGADVRKDWVSCTIDGRRQVASSVNRIGLALYNIVSIC